MNDLIELTEDEFDTRFPLRTNHLNPHASWAVGEGRGCLFETFGEELDFVRKQHPSTIWTLVDGEDGDMYLHSGMHFVNRIGYLVSMTPVPEGVDIQVHIPMQPEEQVGAMSRTEQFRSDAMHTPGPWDYRPNEDGKPVTNGTVAIAYMDAYQPEEQDRGLWECETEANGRLVAAAPAQAILLDMLRRRVLTLGEGNAEFEGVVYNFDSTRPDWNALLQAIGWDTARAVVATAGPKGRAHLHVTLDLGDRT